MVPSLKEFSIVLEMVEWLHFVEQQVEDNEGARTLHLAHQAARDRLDDDEKKAYCAEEFDLADDKKKVRQSQ